MDLDDSDIGWLALSSSSSKQGGEKKTSNISGGPRNMNSIASSKQRPPFGITVMEQNGVLGEKDITVLHSKWDPEKNKILVPGQRRLAVQWQSAHTYFTHDGHEMFICNICGRDLKLSGSVSAITAHLTHKHPDIKLKMDELERQEMEDEGGSNMSITTGTLATSNNSSKKRSHSDLPMASRNAISSNKASRSTSAGSVGEAVEKKQGRLSKQTNQPMAEHQQPDKDISLHKNTTQTSANKAQKVSTTEMQKRAQVMHVVGFNLPLAHTESRWHKHLIECTSTAARAGATADELHITKQEIRKTIFSAYKKLREYFKERIGKDNKTICGVVQRYKPNPKITYSTFRVQWVEDFGIFSAVLATHASRGHNGGMGDFNTKLVEWDISSSMKFMVTNDPDAQLHAFHKDAKAMECEQIPCLDYVLQLVAVEGFKDIIGTQYAHLFETDHLSKCLDQYKENEKEQILSPLLRKTLALVQYFQDSIKANDELMRIADQLRQDDEEETLNNLYQDKSRKWWSMQAMLEQVLALREAISVYVGRQWSRSNNVTIRPPKFTEEEWEQMEELCLVLSPLRFASKLMNGVKYPTAPLVVLVIHLIYRDLEKNYSNKESSAKVIAATRRMLNEMDRVVGNFCSRKFEAGGYAGEHCQININHAFLYAHALDPRFKKLAVFPAKVKELVWKGILQEMVRLSPIMETSSKPPETDEEKEKTSDRQSAGSVELDTLFQLYAHKQNTSLKKQPEQIHVDDWTRKCEVELKKYRECEGTAPDLETDVLKQWWGTTGHIEFPILWRLTERFFAITATSAPSDQAFSVESNAFINREFMLESDGMLHFLQENLEFLRDGRFLCMKNTTDV